MIGNDNEFQTNKRIIQDRDKIHHKGNNPIKNMGLEEHEGKTNIHAHTCHSCGGVIEPDGEG